MPKLTFRHLMGSILTRYLIKAERILPKYRYSGKDNTSKT